jgi:hypothetical protein
MALCGCNKCGWELPDWWGKKYPYRMDCPYFDYSTNKERAHCYPCTSPQCRDAVKNRLDREARELELRVLRRTEERLDEGRLDFENWSL